MQGYRPASAPHGDPSGGRSSSFPAPSMQQHPCDVLRTPSLGDWFWNGTPPPCAPDGHARMAPGYPGCSPVLQTLPSRCHTLAGVRCLMRCSSHGDPLVNAEEPP